jgi:hypothetical protein
MKGTGSCMQFTAMYGACVRACVCRGGCNASVCEGFVMCGCFGNMYTVL